MAFPLILGLKISECANLITALFGLSGILDALFSWFGFGSSSSRDEKIQRGIDNITRSLLNINNTFVKTASPNIITDPRELSLTTGVILPLYASGDEENNFRNFFLLIYKALTGINMLPDPENPDLALDSACIGQFPFVGISPFLDNFFTKITNIDSSVELLKDSFYFIDENEVGVSIAELFSSNSDLFFDKITNIDSSIESLKDSFYFTDENNIVHSFADLFKNNDLSVDLTELVELFKITIGENDYNITQVLKNIFTISVNPDFSDNIAGGFLAVGSRAVDEVAKAY